MLGLPCLPSVSKGAIQEGPLFPAATFSLEESMAIIPPIAWKDTDPNKSIVPGYVITIKQCRIEVTRGKDPRGGGERGGGFLGPSPWSWYLVFMTW